jgi:cytoskeletal protein CcmA (bactofilin family)
MSQDINALLGHGSEFEGKLTFEGTVRIDGKFTGEIFSDGTLIVGEGAEVQAEVRVANVMVYGEVVGNITSTESVELHAPASLRGNITAPALHIDKGVYFDGACQMTGDREDAPAQDASRAAPPSAQDAARRLSGLYGTDAELDGPQAPVDPRF